MQSRVSMQRLVWWTWAGAGSILFCVLVDSEEQYQTVNLTGGKIKLWACGPKWNVTVLGPRHFSSGPPAEKLHLIVWRVNTSQKAVNSLLLDVVTNPGEAGVSFQSPLWHRTDLIFTWSWKVEQTEVNDGTFLFSVEFDRRDLNNWWN